MNLPTRLRYWADYLETDKRSGHLSVYCVETLREAAVEIEELDKERLLWLEATLNPTRLRVPE